MTNILILSCGTRNKIIQYFKKTLCGKGNVIATDCSRYAPALYDADKYYIVSRMIEPGYLDEILNICQTEKISGVLSLIDPELALLAKNKDLFESIGTKVVGSSYELCNRALNKMEMYKWLLGQGYNCAKSYDSIERFEIDRKNEEIMFPLYVKPICGSASVSTRKVYDIDTLRLICKQNENMMIQEYLNGQEIGVDCYIDLISGEAISIFTKKKLLMRAGETDKAISFKDEKLFELISKFARESGWTGAIDIDVFDVDGKYYISEVNPRFGGGYPHAYESGCNFMAAIINNLEGVVNSSCIGEYENGTVMMKYNETKMLK